MMHALETIANARRDFVEWHRGRLEYLLWALDVDLPAVRSSVTVAQAHLAGWLLEDYQRQPHITLGLCGFPCPSAQHADEFDQHLLTDQLQALRRAAWPPLEIEIGEMATFSSAPYLRVRASGTLLKLRECLARSPFNQAHTDLTPHVTVGLYRDHWPMDAVLNRISAAGRADPIHLIVDYLCLMSYDTRNICGPLTTLARYDLRHNTLHWIAPHPVLNPSVPFQPHEGYDAETFLPDPGVKGVA